VSVGARININIYNLVSSSQLLRSSLPHKPALFRLAPLTPLIYKPALFCFPSSTALHSQASLVPDYPFLLPGEGDLAKSTTLFYHHHHRLIMRFSAVTLIAIAMSAASQAVVALPLEARSHAGVHHHARLPEASSEVESFARGYVFLTNRRHSRQIRTADY
jgi:hypothetical protein